MKFSWLTTITVTALILRATPALAQDEVTATQPDPGLEPAATSLQLDATLEPTASQLSPDVPPTPEVTGEPIPPDQTEGDNQPTGGGDEFYNVIPHLPDDCSDIRIFSVRGSDEPYPGRGGAMLGVMCSLFESTGNSCDYEDVVYPANISHSGIFCQSANIGAFAGQAQMTAYIERCPASQLILTGYSQGGSVVGDILGGGGGALFGCEQAWNPALSRNVTPGSRIAAAVTFGAPRFTANQSYNIGNGSTFNGVLGREGRQLSDLNEYEDIMAMWCNAGDPVCAVGSEPINITAHWSYYDEYTEVASRWVVATALGQTDVRLDLNLDGREESVVLTNSSSRNGNDSSDGDGGGDEGGALSRYSGGGLGVVTLVAMVTAGLISMV